MRGPQQPPQCFCVCGQPPPLSPQPPLPAGGQRCRSCPRLRSLCGQPWRSRRNSLLRFAVSGGLGRVGGWGSEGEVWGVPWSRGRSSRGMSRRFPKAPGGETRPGSVLGKCSHGQKSRVLIRASYLHATQFKNRLHLNQKHVFGFVPILSSPFSFVCPPPSSAPGSPARLRWEEP